jgi:hypothetical protein
MSKSIFISHVYEDRNWINNIKDWGVTRKLGIVVITHEMEDKRILGRDAIKSYLKSKIEGISLLLVLIGQNTHNHDWITVEVELANSYHKKIVCLRIPNTKGNVPPILNNYPIIDFKPELLKKVLEEI